MCELKHLQNQLLQSIFSSTEETPFEKKGLAIYRKNLRATATRTLTITFPTVTQLIGEELLGHVAEKLLLSDPPAHGDWAQWGEGLAELLINLPALENYPFVAECAQLDYLCHQLIREKDHYFEQDSLVLLQQHDPQQLYLVPNPTLRLITSAFPLADIRHAHRLEHDAQQQALKDAVERSFLTSQFYYACYRNGQDVEISSLSEMEYKWLCILYQNSLDDALNKMADKPFSLQDWMINALHKNLLQRISIAPKETTNFLLHGPDQCNLQALL